jgi:glycosyltransferase involved in cell wall biosynthesis
MFQRSWFRTHTGNDAKNGEEFGIPAVEAMAGATPVILFSATALPDVPGRRTIQYMALGIPVVASPIDMAADVVEHGTNGFWAITAEEWFQGLNLLIRDANLRYQFAVNGRKTVEQQYSLHIWGPRLVELLEVVLNGSHVNGAGTGVRELLA